MKQEINPQDSSRAEAFSLWMSSPMPMVTLVKTCENMELDDYMIVGTLSSSCSVCRM